MIMVDKHIHIHPSSSVDIVYISQLFEKHRNQPDRMYFALGSHPLSELCVYKQMYSLYTSRYIHAHKNAF